MHWLNTVKISQSTLETFLGPARVDSRARNFFILGASLSALFDISVASDFLRALLRLLEEWEAFTENSAGKGVVSCRYRAAPKKLTPCRKICFAGRTEARSPLREEWQK